MYSRKSVELGLKVAEEDLGYELVYHSVEACDEAAAHFDDKLQRYKEQYGEPPYTPSTPRMLFTREEVKSVSYTHLDVYKRQGGYNNYNSYGARHGSLPTVISSDYTCLLYTSRCV